MKHSAGCLLFFLTLAINSFGQNLHLVKPSSTDQSIDINDNNHFVYFNPEADAKNELFVFFPGTGGLPLHYTFILKEAANLGYHSIGLTYPNDRTINGFSICGLTLDTTCHSRARHEVFDGIDRHPQVDVNQSNSIQNRLYKLIDYLKESFPEENWEQYFNGNQIRWEKVKLAGHSQGGGHAGFIATLVSVERAIMMASNDRIGLLGRNADWLKKEGATENKRYFGLLHSMDELIDFDNALESWNDRGMFENNFLVNVDTSQTPDNYSNTLYTEITPRNNEEKFHNSLAVDLYTPLDEQDRPILANVWKHLISDPIKLPSAVIDVKNESRFTIYPNPGKGIVNLQILGEWNNLEVKIFNLSGQLVYENHIFSDHDFWDLGMLDKNLYVVSIYSGRNKLYSQLLLLF